MLPPGINSGKIHSRHIISLQFVMPFFCGLQDLHRFRDTLVIAMGGGKDQLGPIGHPFMVQ